MPYRTSKDLPPAIQKLPQHAQEIYRAAFNSGWEQTKGDEGGSAQIAWAAVKQKYKKVGDTWTEKLGN